MKITSTRAAVLSTLLTLLLLAPGGLTSGLRAAATPGTFRGEIVEAPHGERSAGMLYLMGRDGNVRRVLVTRATVVYDSQVPSGDRLLPAQKALTPGALVRVTALIDSRSGEWTASRVEVMAHHAEEMPGDDDSDDPAETRETAMARYTV